MIGYRRFYHDSLIAKPYLRGLFLLPAYIATIYCQFTIVNISIMAMLLYWAMHIQLLISLLFHIFHFGQYDLLSCYLDRLSVTVVNSAMTIVIGAGLHSKAIVAIAAASPIIYVMDPEANIRISVMQFAIGMIAGIMDTIYNPENGLWWVYQILSTSVIALIYIFEIYGTFPVKNKWIGWHDIFHALINIPYIFRLMSTPGIF